MPPAALERAAGPVAAAAAMAAIDPAALSLAAFLKKSRLWSIGFVHSREGGAASSVHGVNTNQSHFERQVKSQKAKVKRQKCVGTWLGCTNFGCSVHRHLAVLRDIRKTARGACSQGKEWFAQ